MIDKLKEIKATLQQDVEHMEANGDEMKRVSWGNQEGILISGEDAKVLAEAAKRYIEMVMAYKGIFGKEHFEK